MVMVTETIERECCDENKDLVPYKGKPINEIMPSRFCKHCGQLFKVVHYTDEAGSKDYRYEKLSGVALFTKGDPLDQKSAILFDSEGYLFLGHYDAEMKLWLISQTMGVETLLPSQVKHWAYFDEVCDGVKG